MNMNNKESIAKFLESKDKIKIKNSLDEKITKNQNLSISENEELKKKLLIKESLIKNKKYLPKKLKDKINEHIEVIDRLESEIFNIKTLFEQSIDIASIALFELRKMNPKKANEIEYSMALKKNKKNT